LPTSAVPTDLPALLLTVPAVVATWIGASADRVQRSSISTYIGLGVSTAVSLASSLLYVANANHKSFFTIGSFIFYHGLIHLKHVDMSWLILALIASLMSGYLAETLRDKVRNYLNLLLAMRSKVMIDVSLPEFYTCSHERQVTYVFR
jgi:hypothetical protein